jgi:hypothetical protein
MCRRTDFACEIVVCLWWAAPAHGLSIGSKPRDHFLKAHADAMKSIVVAQFGDKRLSGGQGAVMSLGHDVPLDKVLVSVGCLRTAIDRPHHVEGPGFSTQQSD